MALLGREGQIRLGVMPGNPRWGGHARYKIYTTAPTPTPAATTTTASASNATPANVSLIARAHGAMSRVAPNPVRVVKGPVTPRTCPALLWSRPSCCGGVCGNSGQWIR